MLKPNFLFIHTVTLRRFLGAGMSGNNYGEPETIRCRVELSQKKFKVQGTTGGANQEVIASGTIYMPAGSRLEPQSMIQCGSRAFSVLSVEPIWDLTESHVEVTIL